MDFTANQPMWVILCRKLINDQYIIIQDLWYNQ